MTQKCAKSAESVQKVLNQLGLDVNVLELPSTTRTALDAAASIGCDLSQIVKSLVFRTKETDRPVVVLASGPNRVDEKQISLQVGECVVKADATYVRQVTGFAIGGIPPVGHIQSIALIYIDEALLTHDEVWAAAGTPNAVFCINTKVLIDITQANVISMADSKA